MLALAMAIMCGDPRAYEGPRETPSPEHEIDPLEHAARNESDPPPPDPAADRPRPPPELLPAPPLTAHGIEPRLTGNGLLIAGTLFTGAAFLTSAISVGVLYAPCDGFCEPYGALFAGLAAPVPWLVGTAMLGVGMQRRRFDLSTSRWESGLPVRPPRRGAFGAGLAMTIIGSAAIVATWPLFFVNSTVQLGAGPLAVAGAMMAGTARGRRLERRRHVTVAPITTRTTAMLSLRVAW